MTRAHDEVQKTYSHLGQHLVSMVSRMTPAEICQHVLGGFDDSPERIAECLLEFLDRHQTCRGFAIKVRRALAKRSEEVNAHPKDRLVKDAERLKKEIAKDKECLDERTPCTPAMARNDPNLLCVACAARYHATMLLNRLQDCRDAKRGSK